MAASTIRIAINGFGRIGRTILRVLAQDGRPDIELVAINDLAPLATAAHLLEFDSVFGRFPQPVSHLRQSLRIGDASVRYSSARNPAELDWSDVDIVLECTGAKDNLGLARSQIASGAGRVLVSGPCVGADKTIVLGANDDQLTVAHRVVSNASCTTNAIAPLLRLLDDAVGISVANMTTVHCYTGSQPVLDTAKASLERSRAAALSIVSTTSSAFNLLGEILPGLKGRVTGSAIRVPTPSVSSVDLVFEAENLTSLDDIHHVINRASGSKLSGIVDVETRAVVSVDLRATRASVTVTPHLSVEVGNGLFRLFGWYDNEWGFSCRMIELAHRMVLQDRNHT